MSIQESMSSAQYRERILGEAPKSKPPVPAQHRERVARAGAPQPGRHARAAATCDVLAEAIRALTTAVVVREWAFHPERGWLFDIAIPSARLAVEVDGGSFTGGHSRGTAYAAECEKFNEATLLGWRVLRFTNKQARGPSALGTIRAALERAS